MSASSRTAIKASLEATTPSLGVPIYPDDAIPPGATPPYLVVTDGVSDVPTRGRLYTTELAQVDVYEPTVDRATNTRGESYALAKEVMRRLHHLDIPTAPERILQCRVLNRIRLRSVKENTVRNTVNVALKRKLS